jgi:hypothetical protein
MHLPKKLHKRPIILQIIKFNYFFWPALWKICEKAADSDVTQGADRHPRFLSRFPTTLGPAFDPWDFFC